MLLVRMFWSVMTRLEFTVKLWPSTVVMAVLTGLMLKHTIMRGEASPFVMELPVYHVPHIKSLIIQTWQRLKGFVLRAGKVIVIVSMAHSPQVAFSSLGFLVVIHKLEYFLNARIVGGQINARAWELLTAMLVMESAFGIAGLVAAPIAYAWLKDELGALGLI